MIKTSTHNDIIKYLYEETTQDETESIESDLIFNEEAVQTYQELAAIKRSLDKTFKEPVKRVIDNILNYSKSLNLHPVKNSD
jgi:uncharacterized phage-associated protein